MADTAALHGEWDSLPPPSGAVASSATPAAIKAPNRGLRLLPERITPAPPTNVAGTGTAVSRPRRSSVVKQLSFSSASDDDSDAAPRSHRRSRSASASTPAPLVNASAGRRDSGVGSPLEALSEAASDRSSPDTPQAPSETHACVPSETAVVRKRRRVHSASSAPAAAVGCPVLEAAGNIYLTTYATVSAKQRKTFRSDEWKNRPKAQNKMLAPSTPPKGIGGLLELNNLVTWPLVRIGETFEIIFKPDSGTGEWTGVGKATTQIQGEHHSAIRFANVGARDDEVTKANAKVIRIENYFWDATLQQTRCLRCAALSPECKCPFPNDLLQTCPERPGERCEIAKAPGGMLGITVRIPRTRKQPANSDSKDKPINNWMKGLPKPPGGDIRTPKAMELRVVEETHTSRGVTTHTHKGYVRLAAKNGAIRLKQGLSPSPTLRAGVHPAAETTAQSARLGLHSLPAKRQMTVALATSTKPMVELAAPSFPRALRGEPIGCEGFVAVQRSPFKLESLIVAAQIERQKEDTAL